MRSREKVTYLFVGLFVFVSFFTFKSGLFSRLSTSLVIPPVVSKSNNYDKLKVDIFKIDERLTGTEPFNVGSVSNNNGVDVSPYDNYIRTNDTINYTLEVRVLGTGDYKDENGGILKVRGKLPNQGSPTLMVFEKQAWMRNVVLSEDKTEIYAEYHYDSNQTPIGNQTLTFTVKALGYKKNVTAAMRPTFEAWMEGNKPDDSSSSIPSKTIVDSSPIIISGHQSLDVFVTSPSYTVETDYQGKYGLLHSIVYGLALQQDVIEFPDLRGIEYPYGEISFDYDIEYKYNDLNTGNGYVTITSSTPQANGLLNGTKLIDTGYNCGSANFYPSNTGNYHSCGLVRGDALNTPYSVQGSGDYTVNFNSNKFSVSIKNYVLNGTFPTRNGWNTGDLSKKTGYFSILATQFFSPVYRPNPSHSYDYTISYTLKNVRYGDINNNRYSLSYNDSSVKDAVTTNNSIAYGFSTRVGGSFSHTMAPLIWEFPSTHMKRAIYNEQEFTVESYQVITRDYPSGTDHFITWDNRKLELEPIDGDKYIYIRSNGNIYGFQSLDTSTIITKFGVYKNDRVNGPTSSTNRNKAYLEDYDWYNSYEDAKRTGNITALYMRYVGNVTKGNNVVTRYKFLAHVTPSDIGNTTYIVSKGRAFESLSGSTVINDIIYTNEYSEGLHSETYFSPTQYNSLGDVITYETPPEHGETYLMIGYMTSVTTTVSDLDSDGKEKAIYDVQDGVINFKVIPEIKNGKDIHDNDQIIDEVLVSTVLPKGLSYRNGSSNINPISVVVNEDETTTITWKYNNYQVNHDPPGYRNITFKANLSLDLVNNSQLEVHSTIFAKGDLRDEEAFRTGKYGVTIINLAGSKGIKYLDPDIIDVNKSFKVETAIGNTSSSNLINIKTVEVLPKGNDGTSHFSGTYTMKVLSLAPGEKIYYTTVPVENSGIVKDSSNIYVGDSISFATDSRWHEVGINGIIPQNATAIGSTIPKISSKTMESHILQVNTNGNRQKDKYVFSSSFTSDTLDTSVKTNSVIAYVRDYIIKGMAFKDQQNTNVYEEKLDKKLSGIVVELYDKNGNLVKTTTTDSNGNYVFDYLTNQKYYVKFVIDRTGHIYEVVDKNVSTKEVSSVCNSNYQTDLYAFNGLEREVIIDNVNFGLKEKFKIVTKGIGDGGVVSGDEVIYQGTDSTPNYIIIHADEAYYIASIKINGIAQNVTNVNDMVLDNFKSIQENKLIEVTFKPNKITTIVMEEGTDIRLPDATITLFKDGSVVGECITDENGECSIKKIFHGDYTLIETEQPDGYVYSKDVRNVLVTNDSYIKIDDGERGVEVETIIYNKPTEIDVVKRDAATAEILYGDEIKFKLEGPHGYEEIGTISSKEGYKFHHLKRGNYILSEISTKDDYIKSFDKITFVVNKKGLVLANNNLRNLFTYFNFKKPKLNIETVGEDNNELLSYVKYKIINTLDDTFEIVDSGEIYLGEGIYKIVEYDPETGYKLSDEEKLVEVISSGSLYVDNVLNENDATLTYHEVPTIVKIRKVDENGNMISGAHFEIYKDDVLYDSFVSLLNDYELVKPENGVYTVKEVQSADGYIKSDEIYSFSVTSTGVSQDLIIVTNELMPKVNIKIIDNDTQEHINDAIMVIKDKDGELVTYTSVDEIYSIRLPYGDYTISEVKPGDNHIPSETVYSFSLDKDSPKTINIDFYSDPYYTVKIINEDINNEYLEGAKFELKDSDGNVIKSFTQDENPIVINNLVKGEYTLEQIEPPIGYVLNDEVIKFTIEKNDNDKEVIVINEEIYVPRTDSDSRFMIISTILFVIGLVFIGVYKNDKKIRRSYEIKKM